jgi:hypothetical protein
VPPTVPPVFFLFSSTKQQSGTVARLEQEKDIHVRACARARARTYVYIPENRDKSVPPMALIFIFKAFFGGTFRGTGVAR